ncbi:MAG: U32 family peptidase [Candidatus Pacebacteria bacterium]|jgi:U32 family peptidase|nr:U32 family peptidase [Candidatus Paceibacterota bacterium]MBT4652113.1 U32 family peptidase [Candidatus Paceibacterota bacterium]MBT6756544.1 U32 family peptidase [Candidatus Paceibacterota bacterium]MBT6921369.1 U32 family peptidase [Candidatus Paceibacterota bacterium]
MKKPLILAPAGSKKSLIAAINAGCDEVFFGIGMMNMRASGAVNFSIDNLKETVDYCHKNGVKVCVTVNTLLYNSDIPEMKKIIDAIAKSGVDAAIVADMSTMQYASEKGVEIHISTQLSISNTESLKFYAKYADRIVLARELRLEQVAQICKDVIDQDIRGPKGELIEIEVFAHGAICVAVSGRCSMSMYCYDKSANRGQCGQACRRKYKITDVNTGQELVVDNNYVMSAADLCTIGMLDKIVEAGVSVLKFEGRGRPPEYVDLVTRTYKQALQSIEEGKYTTKKIEQWNKDLGTVFNRGQSAGFYMGRKMDEWAGGNGGKATKKKVFAGKVEYYYPKIKVVQIKVMGKVEFQKGNEFLIIGDKTGIVKDKFTDILIDDKKVKKAQQGDVITFKLDQKVREEDDFYLWNNA